MSPLSQEPSRCRREPPYVHDARRKMNLRFIRALWKHDFAHAENEILVCRCWRGTRSGERPGSSACPESVAQSETVGVIGGEPLEQVEDVSAQAQPMGRSGGERQGAQGRGGR